MNQGRGAAEAGLVFGHENVGVVIETRPGVTLLKRGDRIVLPFNAADGRCRNCEEGCTAFCTGVNPGFVGGAYGLCDHEPVSGRAGAVFACPVCGLQYAEATRGEGA